MAMCFVAISSVSFLILAKRIFSRSGFGKVKISLFIMLIVDSFLK